MNWFLTAMLILLSMPASSMAAKTKPLRHLEGTSYLSNCENFLDAAGTDKVDAELLKAVKSESDFVELLVDYNIVGAARFRIALNTALKDVGIFEPLYIKNVSKVARQINRLATNQDATLLETVTTKTLENIKSLAASLEDPDRARVQHLATVRLLEAIENSDKATLFKSTFKKAIQIALLATVHQLMKNPKDYSSGDLTALDIAKPIVLIGGFGLVGAYFFGSYPADPWFESLGPIGVPLDHAVNYPFSTLFSGAGGFFGLLLGIAIFEKAYNSIAKRMGAEIGQAAPTVKVSRHKKAKAVSSLYRVYNEELPELVVPLTDINCSEDICKLSPPQIAYLGHLEILQIKSLVSTANANFSLTALRQSIENTLSTCRDLTTQAHNYRIQTRCFELVANLYSRFSIGTEERDEHRIAIELAVDEAKSAIAKLNKILFDNNAGSLSPDEIRKHEFVEAKLSSDLASIRDINLDSRALDKSLERAQAEIDELGRLTETPPHAPREWLAWAEQTVLTLEKLQQSAN